jgi:hypothetical protein
MEYVNPLTGFRVDGRRPNEVTPPLPLNPYFRLLTLASDSRSVCLADAAAQGRGRRRLQGRRVRKKAPAAKQNYSIRFR